MFKFTRAGVNLISFIITTIIFSIIQITLYQYVNGVKLNVNITENIMEKQDVYVPIETLKTDDIWQLEIEKIKLKADIVEGTSKEILEDKIGHFTETQTENGNIGLAAHNRGYKVNYFENLKKLKQGDKIKYIHNQYQQTYIVEENIIIKDTDWEKLENTEEDKLTLITCVENEPEYRRCVQGIEKDKEGGN